MLARFVLIAVATLTSAAASADEPAKPPVQPAAEQPAPPHAATPQIVLASANVAGAPSTAAEPKAANPPRRRMGRVTTCRCGGQQPQPEQ
ncbi:MAG TPA: hypothetical protein VFK28_11180 [Sphingomicrobium sp.]|nr:hypothetical protein [Sphingomicrobium sp.]